MAIRKERTEIYVGLFVFFGLAIMGTLIFQYGRFSDHLRGTYTVEVTFPDASGIIRGSPVRLAGQRVGFVAKEPNLTDDFTAVVMPLSIYDDRKIPRGSRFTIATSGLMGDTYVNIRMADQPSPEYLHEGERVTGERESGLTALQEDAGQVLQDIRSAVRDIQTAVGSLDRIFTKIEHDMLADENIENMKATFADLKKSGENIRSATGKLEPLVDEAKETMTEAKTTMTKAGDAFDRAKELIEKADPAVEDLQPVLAELKATIANANRAVSQIADGSGVAAALISDSELKDDLKSFISKLERHGVLGYPKDRRSAPSATTRGGAPAPPASRPPASRPPTRPTPVQSEPDDRPGLLNRLFQKKDP